MARINMEMVEKAAATIKNLSLEVRALYFTEADKFSPTDDPDVMRVALLLGLIGLSLIEYDQLSKRVWVDEWLENEVRREVYDAMSKVIELSGKPMSEIDFLLWSARRYCPEMTEPDCSKCVFDNICQKRTKLFQPVFRTTNY